MRHTDELFYRMLAAENEDAPDGAWWAILQDTARHHAEDRGLEITEAEAFDAVQAYITWKK